jgi:hypothetical protein
MWGTVNASIGEEVTLSVDVQSNEYASVVFTVWEEGADKENDQPVKRINASAIDGKAEAHWRYMVTYDPDNPPSESARFTFTADSFLCDQVESGVVEWKDKIEIDFADSEGDKLKDVKFKIIGTDGNITVNDINDDGKLREERIMPGYCAIKFIFNEDASDTNINTNNLATLRGTQEVEDGPFKIELGANHLKDGFRLLTGRNYELIIPIFKARLEIDPNDQESDDDKVILISTDDENYYKRTLSVKDDKREQGNFFDLHFQGVREDLCYTLEVDKGSEGKIFKIFEDVPLTQFAEENNES